MFSVCQTFSSEQLVQRNAEQVRQGKKQYKVRISLSPFPFGNRLHADVQVIRHLALRHALFSSQGSDVGSDWNAQTLSSCADDQTASSPRTGDLCGRAAPSSDGAAPLSLAVAYRTATASDTAFSKNAQKIIHSPPFIKNNNRTERARLQNTPVRYGYILARTTSGVKHRSVNRWFIFICYTSLRR